MTINKYRDVISRSWNEGAPMTAHFELTFRCNLDCSFCYNEKIFGGELTTQEIHKTLESLAHMGVLNLNLSGGEPFVRKDLKQIVDRAQELGFAVKIYTNGVLIDEAWARYLGEAGIFGLEISIHSDEPELMDKTTKVPGSFKMLMEALERCKRHGVNVVLKTPVTRHNLEHLVGIKKIADSFGFTLFCDAKITPRDDGDQSPLFEDGMTPEQLNYYWNVISPQLGLSAYNAPKPASVHDEAKPICGAGSASVVLDPFGNVLPCVAWRRPLGNVREQSLEAIWLQGGDAKEVRQLAHDAVAITSSNPDGAFAFYCLARVHQSEDQDKTTGAIFQEAAIKRAAYEKLVQIAPTSSQGGGR